MMNQLRDAIEVLKTADPAMGYVGADPVYDNNLTKWTRFANSLRLRLAMRTRFVEPANSSAVITECMAEEFIENNDGNFGLKYQESENPELYNPWYDVRKHQNWKMSDKFVEWLKSTNDPRLITFVDTTAAPESIKDLLTVLMIRNSQNTSGMISQIPNRHCMQRICPRI